MMITEPALGEDRKIPPSREPCTAGRTAQPLWYECGAKELQVPVHVVIPGHLDSLLTRHRLDHCLRFGVSGAPRVQ